MLTSSSLAMVRSLFTLVTVVGTTGCFAAPLIAASAASSSAQKPAAAQPATASADPTTRGAIPASAAHPSGTAAPATSSEMATSPTTTPAPAPVALPSLGLVIELAGDVDKHIELDDDRKPTTEAKKGVKAELWTTLPAVRRYYVELLAKPETAKAVADRRRGFVAKDMTGLEIEELPGAGWLMTYRYDKDRARVVILDRKIGKRRVRCEAYPNTDEGTQIAITACKSLRPE